MSEVGSIVTDSESATESVEFSGVCPNPNPQIFAAVSDGFASSVRESIFTYQVAVFKRCCVTVAAGHRHRLIGSRRRREGWGGQWHYDHWSGEQWAAMGHVA